MYNRLLERGRSTQILCPSNVNSNTAEHHVNARKCLQYLDDLLVVSKIQAEPENVIDQGIDGDVIAAMNSLLEEELAEQNQVSKENGEIVKKQFQILQADERGRQAINTEIAEIRKQQEERLKTLRARKHALEIEKARAKRISSMPPPLPKSIKLLLKEKKNEIFDAPKNHTSEIDPNDPCDEIMDSADKENILLTDEEIKAAEKLKEERNVKAQKRFNEALKKDRQKKEQDELLKKIDEAERSQRRETAKNISEKGTKMPCFYPDRLHTMMKKADMENAVEKVCRESNSKEHAIEDIEGYEDLWEKKYENVNSGLQVKLMDCIPNFVKENYEYLLQEESEYQVGNRFSDEIESELNLGFIESSPVLSPRNEKEDSMDIVITKLDERRAQLQSTYEKTIKPYLEAEIDASKKDYSDKSVGADILKPPAEDKAVEANIPSLQTPPYVDYLNAGVMAFKRRHMGPNFKFFKTEDFDTKNTYNYSQSERNGHRCDNWSSSSYCSLPPNHGMPNFDHFCNLNSSCDICIAERNAFLSNTLSQGNNDRKDSEENKYPKTSPPCMNDQESYSSRKSSLLSSYVKQIVEKYLVEKSVSPAFSKGNFQQIVEKSVNNITSSQPETNEIHSDSKSSASSSSAQNATSYPSTSLNLDEYNKEFTPKPESDTQLDVRPEKLSQSSSSTRIDKPASEDDISLKSSIVKQYKAPEEFDQEAENARLKLIKQFVFKNSPKSSSGLNIHVSPLESEKPDIVVGKSEFPHVYHELSTIQEMDSALTSETPHMSYSESLLEQKSLKKGESKSEGEISEQALEEKCIDTISLLDAPPSPVTELAKNIYFVTSSENTVRAPPFIEEPKVSSVSSSSDKINSVTTKTHDVPKLDSISVSSLSLSSSCKVSFSPKKSFDSSSSSIASMPRESTPHFQHGKKFQNYFTDISNIQQENFEGDSTSVQKNATVIPSKYNQNKIEKDSTFHEKSKTLKNYNIGSRFHSNLNSFHPMSSCSDISSDEMGKNAFEKRGSSNIELHEHRDLDSIIAAKIFPLVEESGISRNFYPLSSCSKTLTPSSIEHVSNQKSDTLSDSVSTFKALSPVSNISTPLSSNSKSQQNFNSSESLNSVDFKPMTLCFNISTPCSERTTSDKSENLRNITNSQELLGVPSLSSITCNVTIHAKSSRSHSNLSENGQIPNLKAATNLCSPDLFLPNLSEFPQAAIVKDKTSTKKSIHPCKSDYFIPQLNVSDFSAVNDMYEADFPVFEIGSQETENDCVLGNNKKILCPFAAQKNSISDENECKTKTLLSANAVSSVTSNDVAVQEAPELTLSSKAQYLPPLRKSHSLQSLASCSSSENLAEMFIGSKIAYQSTPVKNFDCTQEELILNEPDLTLVSTISCESILPQKPQKALDTLNVKENLGDALLSVKNTPLACMDKIVVSSSDGLVQTGCVDSPSMMSFLQHEISCFTPESAQAKIEMNEKKNIKEKYKDRTKRLWNNLEEVQKKQLQQSKKQQVLANRLKAKEFSKKLTPKRKEDKQKSKE